jgi:hypothetical protein
MGQMILEQKQDEVIQAAMDYIEYIAAREELKRTYQEKINGELQFFQLQHATFPRDVLKIGIASLRTLAQNTFGGKVSLSIPEPNVSYWRGELTQQFVLEELHKYWDGLSRQYAGNKGRSLANAQAAKRLSQLMRPETITRRKGKVDWSVSAFIKTYFLPRLCYGDDSTHVEGLKLVAMVLGQTGNTEAAAQIEDALQSRVLLDEFESRKKVALGPDMNVTLFREKVQVTFSEELFDTIWAFVAEHKGFSQES